MRISDVSSYVCSSDLARVAANLVQGIQFVAKFDAVDHDSPLLVLFEPVYAPDQCRFPRPRGPADHDFFLVFYTDVYVFQNMEMSEPLIDIVHGNGIFRVVLHVSGSRGNGKAWPHRSVAGLYRCSIRL